MVPRAHIAAALMLVPVLLACDVFGIPLLTPTASAPVFPTDTPVRIPPLTVEQVLNAGYTISDISGATHVYQFSDGAFVRGVDPAAADYVSIHLVAVEPDRQVIFGDLNRDGVEDAAVIIAENYGGTGVFVSVAAVLNDHGQPRHVASYGIDDRPMIHSFEVRDGGLFLDATVHGPNDPGCCPAAPVTRTFRLTGAQLMLVGATSRTPSGSERVITIETPTDGTQAAGTLQLTGSVTIAPFENNLSYSFYGPDGNELARGPVMVAAPDFGSPGTFDVTLDLAGYPAGPVTLMVADFSAADGAVLALDSVELTIR